MNPQFKREEQLFTTARALPAAERAAFLAQACAGDTELRERLEALLGADAAAAAAGFMASPPVAGGAGAMAAPAPGLAPTPPKS